MGKTHDIEMILTREITNPIVPIVSGNTFIELVFWHHGHKLSKNSYPVIHGDNHYEYAINVSLHSTQVGPEFGDVGARFIGSKGMAEAHYSGGVFLSSLHDADANKEIHFIKSIETGNYLNEASSGVESTLSAIQS